jgi:ATP-dependent Clp protease protease subunit
MKFASLLAAAFLLLPSVAAADNLFKPSQSSVKTPHEKAIIDENTIIFRGEVNTELISKTMDKMYKSTQDKIVIFIDSPGGSVMDGIKMFDFIANFPKPTICYINFAASMAFGLAQACTERYVTDASFMMQHQASFGGEGTVGKMSEMSRFGTSLSDRITTLQAKRMGMSKEAFELRIMNDWWMLGEEAVQNNAADGVVFLECKPELTKGTTKETMKVFIFSIDVVWSACPLISYPLAVVAGKDTPQSTVNKVQEVLNDKIKYARELKGGKID